MTRVKKEVFRADGEIILNKLKSYNIFIHSNGKYWANGEIINFNQLKCMLRKDAATISKGSALDKIIHFTLQRVINEALKARHVNIEETDKINAFALLKK